MRPPNRRQLHQQTFLSNDKYGHVNEQNNVDPQYFLKYMELIKWKWR